jgi:serine/threonine-protein kinase
MSQQSILLQNRYRLLRQIGGGGMSQVYLAEDTRLPGRRCAIKEVTPTRLPPQDRGWALRAFQQEAHMLSHLQHIGLTTITDFFPEGGNWYLVMDYVEGETLDARLQREPNGRLSLQETSSIVGQLCDVLECLHEQTPLVIFRDLKPGNVMLTPTGQVKLIDFGIARFFKPGRTRDTVNLGTPGYASPEQYGGLGQSDPRSDVYSLGVLLHQMLTGFDPTTLPMQLPAARTLNPSLPLGIEAVIQRATQTQAHLRFKSVRDFRQALFASNLVPAQPSPSLTPAPGILATILANHQLKVGIVAVGALLGLTAVFIAVLMLRPPPGPAIPTPNIRTTTVSMPGSISSPTSSVPTQRPTVPPAPTVTPTPLPDWVQIPAGNFIRGSTESQIQFAINQLCPTYKSVEDAWCKNSPFDRERQNSGTVSVGAFYIDKYEVTNAQYIECFKVGKCQSPRTSGQNPRKDYFADPGRANYPVIYVTWFDANTYCQWSGGRLPTGDEWEKAARGTDGRLWPWGNQPPTDETNFRPPSQTAVKEEEPYLAGGDLKPVGSFPADASVYGVMDMAGNVMEWVDSWYEPSKREFRGGSWNTIVITTRAASRRGVEPNVATFDIGFRCVRPRP